MKSVLYVLCVAGNVAADEADVGFAVVYLWSSTFLWIDFTTALARAGITCLVPKPKMLPPWISLWVPCSPVMCAAISVCIIIITVVFYMLAETSNSWVHTLFVIPFTQLFSTFTVTLTNTLPTNRSTCIQQQ